MIGSKGFTKFGEDYEVGENTLASPLIVVSPRRSGRYGTEKNESISLNVERQKENQERYPNLFNPNSSAFQTIEMNQKPISYYDNKQSKKSAFSRTPGPKLLPEQEEIDLRSYYNPHDIYEPQSPASFKLFSENGNDRLVQLSNLKNPISCKSPDVISMVSNLVSYSPTPEKLKYNPAFGYGPVKKTVDTNDVLENPFRSSKLNFEEAIMENPSVTIGPSDYALSVQSKVSPSTVPSKVNSSLKSFSGMEIEATVYPKQNFDWKPSAQTSTKSYSGKSKGKEENSLVVSSIESDGSLSSKITKLSLDGDHKQVSKQESAASKAAFKEFSFQFRNKSKVSRTEAEVYALNEVRYMPLETQWRVYIELAELAKKYEDYDKAREYFIHACTIERKASSAWLEWSKMEEEHGRPLEALYILAVGLKFCSLNDTLLPRLIKLHERLHKYSNIRGVLSSLKHESIDKAWKSILEGCLFETRAGNSVVSRKIFKYLMRNVSWYGPIYLEAFRLEEREDNMHAALKIIRKGLQELPRYGPLWFGLMRLIEQKDFLAERKLWQSGILPPLSKLTKESNEAVKSISKELTWRVYFEKFEAEYRSADIAAFYLHQRTKNSLQICRDHMLERCRKTLVQSLLHCPNNLKWKIYLVGARIEISVGNIQKARKLIAQAFAEVPEKSKVNAYVESSRLEEFIGNTTKARKILKSACTKLPSDWKSFFESILLEARMGHILEAIELASEAVEIHNGTGRIWALYIQLCHKWEGSIGYQLKKLNKSSEDSYLVSPKNIVVRNAILEAPKSGEVWCEHGRCCLNPLQVDDFDLGQAQQSFAFAIHFTPQYGDTFIEFLRLELLCSKLLPVICNYLNIDVNSFVDHYVSRDHESDTAQRVNYLDDRPKVEKSFMKESFLNEGERAMRRQFICAVESLLFDHSKISFQDDFPLLNRRCVNADPNYGALWFHTRQQSNDIPSHVLKKAAVQLEHELLDSQAIYAKAVLRYIRKKVVTKCYSSDIAIRSLLEDFKQCDSTLQPDEMLKFCPLIATRDGSVYCNGDFITGSIRMNRIMFNPHDVAESRFKYLHGIDQIVS